MNQFAAPPINPTISITPLTTPAATRDSGGVPTQLANAVPGTTVQGFVINRDAQSNPILRTSIGDILIKSDVFLKTGSEVVFRVDPSQASFAKILSIDGVTPQEYVTNNAPVARQDTISSSTQTAQTGQVVAGKTAPVPLQALLLSTAPPSANAVAANPLLAALASASTPMTAALAKLQLGSTLKVTLLQAQLPTQIANTAAAPNAPHAAAAQNQAPTQQATNTPAVVRPGQPQQTQHVAPLVNANTARAALTPEAPQLPIENYVPNAPLAAKTIEARAGLLQPLPGEAPHETNKPPDQAQQQVTQRPQATPQMPNATAEKQGIPVIVIGHEKDGALVLQGSFGTLKTYMPQPFPVGTKLTIAVEPQQKSAMPPVTSTPLTSDMEHMTSLARDWDSLGDALKWAQTSAPDVARDLMQQIPNVGAKLTSGLIFFIAAVKGGDLRQLIGAKALQTLELKAPEIAARLKQDMGQLQQFFVDSPLTNWSSVMVPMLYNNQLEHARLFFRHDQEGGAGKGGKGDDQRFVLEVDLSQLGDMQFDGFVRNVQRAGKQFDLIVRSVAPLDPHISQEIRQIFENSLQIAGYKGYLGFQHGSEHFVRPMADSGPVSGGAQNNTILA